MKKVTIIVLVLILLISSGYGVYRYFGNKENILPLKEINYLDYFHEKALVNKDTVLYKLDGENYNECIDVLEGTTLLLESSNSKYYKLKDEDYYVYYEDISEVLDVVSVEKYETTTTFDKPIKLFKDGKSLIINEEKTLPIKRVQNSYYVVFNDQEYSFEQDDNKFVIFEEKAEKIPVFMYHFFYDENGEKFSSDNYMGKNHFNEQLTYLRENNYYQPSMKELKRFINNEQDLPKKSVIITMDDGASSVYRYAYPVLKDNNVKATLFILSEYIYNYDETVSENWFMNPKMIMTLKNDPLINLDSHTHNMHGDNAASTSNRIDLVDLETIKVNLEASKEVLGEITSLAYPFGIYNDTAIEALKQENIPLAFTTKSGTVKVGSDPYRLPRIKIYNKITMDKFKSYLN